MLFDTHCHLNAEELLPNIDEVIENAKKVGVNRFLVVGWDKESSFKAVELAKQYDCIYAVVGFHPCNIFDVNDSDFEEVMNLSKEDRVVGIGEIGLDYYWVKDPRDRLKQKEWFIKQIEFANSHRLPVSIHNRDAFADCLSILKEHKPMFGGVMHCYSGSVESLKEILDIGLHIGLGGPLTFTNAKMPKEVCKIAPLESILSETDSPYLAPHPLRGSLNEPKNVVLVVNEIANLKGLPVEKVQAQLYKNALSVFGIIE